MTDIHALSGAYAIDAVSDDERVAFEAHLSQCVTCRLEIDSLREATALLAETTAVEPPAELRSTILGSIASVRPLPPVVAPPSHPARADLDQESEYGAEVVANRRWMRPLLAAAAVVLIGGIGVAVTQPWNGDDPGSSQTTNLAQRVLAAEDADRVTLEFPDGAEATVVRSVREGRAVIVTSAMPAAPEGTDYVLWLQSPDGAFNAAGVMPPAADQTVLLDGDASEAVSAGITIESDPTVQAPTTDPIAVFAF